MKARSFHTLFSTATGFQSGPHDYQTRLAHGECLPDILAVPTGCGKTAAAVLSWAWRRRECPDAHIQRATPRRLIYCLPMRSLVEQIHGDIVRWFANLGWIDNSGLQGRCTGNLKSGSLGMPYRPNWSCDEVPVFLLMGGEEAVEWDAHPDRNAVLVGTQDMLLSRALNRGYAMKPQDWPIAFGLVNVDALWILDEVQLMGSGRTTSVQLQKFRCEPRGLPRASMWMSATIGADSALDGSELRKQQAPEWMQTPEYGEQEIAVLGLGGSDRKKLSNVLDAPKGIRCSARTVEDTSLPDDLLQYASGGRFVLVMVNRVRRAQDLFRRIKECVTDPGSPEVLLLHSRFRPRERRLILNRLRDLIPPNGRIVISTQVLEAGVDLDADVLVTELCPWTSLVQRLGRLNRRGGKQGIVEVLEVPVESPNGGRQSKRRSTRKELEKVQEYQECAALPYIWTDLEKARHRIHQLGSDASILAIGKVDPLPVPLEGPVLRKHHLLDLFDTDPDLSGGHIDISAFVRGDRRELDVSVLWRIIDDDDLTDAPAPHPDEICKVSISRLRNLGGDKRCWLLGLQRSRRRNRAWREVRLDDPSIRPGDTLILGVGDGGYDDELGWLGSDQHKPSSWVNIVGGNRSWVRSDGSAPIPIDNRTEGWGDLYEDPRSYSRQWMELSQHLSVAEIEARQIARSLVPDLADKLATAARWHDIGKALERDADDGDFTPFQDMLCKGGRVTPPDPSSLYAKSNHRGGSMSSRHRFRHEVASALAYLAQNDADDLVAWLIMAHHGKARMTLMSWNDRRLDDVFGVRPGDRVPGRAMSLVSHGEVCELDTELLLPALSHPGWQGRAMKLLEEYKPQFLAYLETLVRVADWRAS